PRRRAGRNRLVGPGIGREERRKREREDQHRRPPPFPSAEHGTIVPGAVGGHHEGPVSGSWSRGKIARKSAPPAGARPAETVPPCTRAIEATMASPRPVP